jgi:hypothetical protein
MPDGAAIFETSGAWEDFSTPSWDLRLLIAIWFKIFQIGSRRPERYAMPKHKSVADVKDELRNARIGACVAENLVSPQRRLGGGPWRLRMSPIGRPIATRGRHANGMRPPPSA